MGITSTVTISSNPYVVYGSTANAAKYFAAEIGDEADAWNANPTMQTQALVTATRLLDRQLWQGSANVTPVPDVALAWPRSNVVDAYGVAVPSNVVPDNIERACYVLAALQILNSDTKTTAVSGSNVESVQAGPAAVKFFRPTLGITGKFPMQVQELIAQYLQGAIGSANSVAQSSGTVDANGNPVTSQFDDADAYGIGRSY